MHKPTLATAHYLTTGRENPFQPRLIQAIESADQIFMAVAFVKLSGLKLIFSALQDAVQRGKTLRILAGDYLGLTEPRALRQLLQLTQDLSAQEHACELKVFETQNLSFHPKAYLFVTQNPGTQDIAQGFAYIGSSNLSRMALQEGIEWNIRIDLHENTGRFIHLLDAYQTLFESAETQWLTPEWIDAYQKRIQKPLTRHQAPLPETDLSEEKDLEPLPHQLEALAALQQARSEGIKKGVVIMATGLGKTYLAAFDSLSVTERTAPRILFVAHRKEILNQAETAFLDIYPDATTGYYMGDQKNKDAEILFASIHTLGQAEHLQQFQPTAFDYIIVDEFHHAAAKSYQGLLRHFKPRFLLGLTATPHRTDGADIFGLCDNNKLYELNLIDGISLNKLASFTYHGIHDKHVDYQRVQWRQGQFSVDDLENIVNTDPRAAQIFERWQQHKQQRTLAFCVSKKHAEFMTQFFTAKGISCAAVHSSSTTQRQEAIDGLNSGRFKILFTVDLFNEGVDIPLIDTVLMLRPTESKILFLQQLGRGLRKTPQLPHKQLQVLDFLGNHHVFLNRPQALWGIENSTQSIKGFIQDYRSRQLDLPQGCELNYDLEVIDWISEWAQSSGAEKIQNTYERLKNTLGSVPTALEMFQAGQDLGKIRKEWGSWFELVDHNGDLTPEEQQCLNQLKAFFKGIETSKLTKSYKMVTLQALIELNGFATPQPLSDIAEQAFDVLSRRQKLRGDLMDVQMVEGIAQYSSFAAVPNDLKKQWQKYWKKNPIGSLCGTWTAQDIVFEVKDDNLHFMPDLKRLDTQSFHNMLQDLIDYQLFRYTPKTSAPQIKTEPPPQTISFKENPLKDYVHGVFMRNEIPALFDLPSGNEMNVGIWNKGYVYLKESGDHVLFVNLQKHGLHAEYQYHDAFKDVYTFDWQSQNRMSPNETTGKRLVNHIHRDEQVHLFVRKERKLKGKGAPFTYCGQVALTSFHGEKPMNMQFALEDEALADFL